MDTTRSRRGGTRWVRILLRALGVAGIAGVAATGALVARDQRRRAALTPQEIRERLQARYDEAAAPPPGDAAANPAEPLAARSGDPGQGMTSCWPGWMRSGLAMPLAVAIFMYWLPSP